MIHREALFHDSSSVNEMGGENGQDLLPFFSIGIGGLRCVTEGYVILKKSKS